MSSVTNEFDTEIELKIDWSDLDLFGHVNNVAFFKYIQASRVHYCEAIGLTSTNEKNKLGFIVASTACDFKQPLNYPGTLKVRARLEEVKNSSFQLKHFIINDNDEVAAIGFDAVVVYDYNKKEKHVITEGLREKMNFKKR